MGRHQTPVRTERRPLIPIQSDPKRQRFRGPKGAGREARAALPADASSADSCDAPILTPVARFAMHIPWDLVLQAIEAFFEVMEAILGRPGTRWF